MRRLEELRVYHLVTPLSRPYVLPFGRVDQFDSFVALAHFADGSSGIGESTPLPGYSHETVALLRVEIGQLARDGDLGTFLRRNAGNPFVTAPLLTCLDEWPLDGYTGLVPLCPILQWQEYEEIPETVAHLAGQGNAVIKVKLSPSLNECREIVRYIQPAGIAHGVRFRYDANQTLAPAVAGAVVRLLDHPTTELLEQPFPVDGWQPMAALYAWSPVPLMLDESIVNAEDVHRAATCAHLVKFKLAKNGSPSQLLDLVCQARQLGLEVVLGNGVQGTVGCLLEGKVQLAAGLTRPGEMNGFRKIRQDPLGFLVSQVDTGMSVLGELPFAEIRKTLAQTALEVFAVPFESTGRRR